MTKARKKKKRVRERRPAATPRESAERSFRWAARGCAAVGVSLIATALGASYLLPELNRALGPHGNLALRMAGVALVIASTLFGRTKPS